MPELRTEQAHFVASIYKAWQTARAVLGVYPTGGGKTFCFSHIVARHDGGALITAHRKKIIIQISKSLALFGVKHRIIAPTHISREARRQHLRAHDVSFINDSAAVGIGSIQTLTSPASGRDYRLRRWLGGVSLGVFDEGHHYVNSGQWAKGVTALPETARVLFVTATPERCDGKGLGMGADGFADVMIEGPGVKWQMDHGRLSQYKYVCPATNFSVDDIPITASGDFNRNAFRAKVVDSELVGDVVRHYGTHAPGLKTLVFATDVQTAKEMESAFQAAGYKARELNCNTSVAGADRALEAYESGRLDVLINVDLFDEGFDVPDTEAVIMARPTMSLGKYLQQIGRVLRVAEGKSRAIILDCVRNWERHGLPDWPRVWALAARERGTRRVKDEIRLRVCVRCTQPYEAYLSACPYCGHVTAPIARRKPDQVGGDLFELDVDALNAVFKAIQRADMSTVSYQQNLVSRGCPAAGIARNVRIHNAAKRRRAVLRCLVDWWVGAQAGRDVGEVHKRFYYRFGVDIGTAFTLREQETNDLICRVSAGFGKDVII